MKINLKTILSGFFSTQALNANFDLIKVAFDKCLFRDGTGPNSMQADLDMGSNRILNLPTPTTPGEPLRKDDQFTAEEAQGFAQVASDSANAAATSAANIADLELRAEQWASNPENVEVEAGKYSALHHAAKAAASAAGVALPQIQVGDSRKVLVVNDEEDGYVLIDIGIDYYFAESLDTVNLWNNPAEGYSIDTVSTGESDPDSGFNAVFHSWTNIDNLDTFHTYTILTGLVVGRSYKASVWAKLTDEARAVLFEYAPSPWYLYTPGGTFSQGLSTFNVWTKLEVEFVATSTTQEIRLGYVPGNNTYEVVEFYSYSPELSILKPA